MGRLEVLCFEVQLFICSSVWASLPNLGNKWVPLAAPNAGGRQTWRTVRDRQGCMGSGGGGDPPPPHHRSRKNLFGTKKAPSENFGRKIGTLGKTGRRSVGGGGWNIAWGGGPHPPPIGGFGDSRTDHNPHRRPALGQGDHWLAGVQGEEHLLLDCHEVGLVEVRLEEAEAVHCHTSGGVGRLGGGGRGEGGGAARGGWKAPT